MVAAAQISAAQSFASVGVGATFHATLGADVTAQLSGGMNPSGPYNFAGLPSYTSGDGVNLTPSTNQLLTFDNSGNIIGGSNSVSVTSEAFTAGAAYQNQGLDYHVTFTNTSTTDAEDVSLSMDVTEKMNAVANTPGGIAEVNAYAGYFYFDGTESESFFNNSLDQDRNNTGPDDFGDVNPAVQNFTVLPPGPSFVSAQSLSTFSIGAGQSVIVDFYASASSTAAVPEPPVALLGLAGIGVLLLRRKSA